MSGTGMQMQVHGAWAAPERSKACLGGPEGLSPSPPGVRTRWGQGCQSFALSREAGGCLNFYGSFLTWQHWH